MRRTWGSCSQQCASVCSYSSSCYDGCYNGAGWTTCGGWGVCKSCSGGCGSTTPCAQQCLGGGGLTTCGGDSQTCAASCDSVCDGGATCNTPCSTNEYWSVSCRNQPGWVASYGPILETQASYEGESYQVHDIKSCGDGEDPSCLAVYLGSCPIGNPYTCCSSFGRNCLWQAQPYPDPICINH